MVKVLKSNRQRDFWTEVKKVHGTASRSASSIDGLSDDQEIADHFANTYEHLFNSVGHSDADLINVKNETDQLCTVQNTPFLSVNEIVKYISILKSYKCDGDIGFNSSHIINGTMKLNVILTSLYNAMLVHGVSPDIMSRATIRPLVKDKLGDVNCRENYRGIASSSSLCKLFDYIISSRYSEQLKSSDHQFAYKNNCSTDMCSILVKDVISFYYKKNTPVYIVVNWMHLKHLIRFILSNYFVNLLSVKFRLLFYAYICLFMCRMEWP